MLNKIYEQNIKLDIVRNYRQNDDRYPIKIFQICTSFVSFRFKGMFSQAFRETFEFFTMGVSVRLSDRSLHREEQNKFHQKWPQWGLSPQPLNHHSNALPTDNIQLPV